MPTSPRRKRRDGTVVRFRPRPGVLGREADEPASVSSWEPEAASSRGDDLFAAVVGSKAHRTRHEDAVVRLVNEFRVKKNLPRLRVDERLRAAARAHSEDMAHRGFCAHENPDGVTPAARMTAAGHPAPGAENVARGQETPRSVMNAWIASPGHHANLVNPSFTAIGVGVSFAGARGPCWTQNFGY
ncbi:CAP domain-containing protein [Lentzea sp. JNUCC 0626]|uniref:CAP domain-containing protein n=1 Tax=Lentzea sp. JNUCC 0626 TaxID=3367513 RepID=UPI003749329D